MALGDLAFLYHKRTTRLTCFRGKCTRIIWPIVILMSLVMGARINCRQVLAFFAKVFPGSTVLTKSQRGSNFPRGSPSIIHPSVAPVILESGFFPLFFPIMRGGQTKRPSHRLSILLGSAR